MNDDPGPEFAEFAGGGTTLMLHRDLAAHAVTLVERIEALRGSRERGAGGRESVHRITLAGGMEIMVRRALRGGMMRHLVSDLFVGLRARPLAELAVTVEARRRKLPVADAVGAMVQWLAPIIYRGWFMTRPLSGMTLWEFVQADDDAAVREHVLTAARESIADIQDGGLWHPDLNLQNLFVTKSGERFAVVILDLDKARLLDWPLQDGMRQHNALRLARSARKLDPHGRYFDAKALSALGAG